MSCVPTWKECLNEAGSKRRRVGSVATVAAPAQLPDEGMKDYFDVWLLSRRFDLQGDRLARAIAATFTRRNTEIPATVPVGLSTGFATEPIKQTQWKAFWRKVVRTEPTPDFAEVVKAARHFLLPAAEAARVDGGSPGYWTNGGPWRAG